MAVSFGSAPCAGPPLDQEDGIDADGLRALTERLRAELVACHRLAMLGTMSAMVAHEFNNLMTPVLARAQDALGRDDPVAMRKALDRTITQVQKSLTITRHLMGLAQPAEDTEQVCRVADAVREAVECAVRPFEKDGIELRLSVPDDLCVRARPILLEQVLLNLMINARQAMKGQSGILKVYAKREEGWIVIDVHDNGRGIPREKLEELFNPFLAAVPAGNSTPDWNSVGLGLHVCRTIAHQHGATLQGQANDGAGCTFRLRWPAAEA